MIELLLAIMGVIVVIRGKIPWLVFGGRSNAYTVDPQRARIIGGVLILPVPINMCLFLVLRVLEARRILTYYLCIDVGMVLLGLLVARLLWRAWREEISPTATPEIVEPAPEG